MNKRKTLITASIALAKLVVVLLLATAINATLLYHALPADNAQWQALIKKLDTYHIESTALAARVEALSHQLQSLDTELQQHARLLDNSSLQALIAKNTQAHQENSRDIQQLNQRLANYKSQLKQKKTRQTSPPTPLKKVPVTRVQPKKETLSPPFSLLSLQWRGSVRVAVVAPLNATSLTQVALVSKGDSFLGWKITAITDNEITLQRAQRTLNVKVNA
ncbi:hypothetical protein [Photobacterium leiognathi]|uniref:hypothetical protein n=1 Tax=Photobacterium leiognathi TaxID=553611 RepID=UPI002982A090|nr:hypothetical protein [Photobacterium leiognathi]